MPWTPTWSNGQVITHTLLNQMLDDDQNFKGNINAGNFNISNIAVLTFNSTGYIAIGTGIGAAGVAAVGLTVTMPNVGGAESVTGILLDRTYGSVGDTIDIVFGSGSGMSSNRAGRLSMSAIAGGESGFILYAQTGAGDGYANEVARFCGGGVHSIKSLPTYADNTAATAGGLTAGRLYRTSAGAVMVVF